VVWSSTAETRTAEIGSRSERLFRVGRLVSLRAENYRQRGLLDDAAESYATYEALSRARGRSTALVLLNQGLLEVDRGDLPAAAEMITASLVALKREGRTQLVGAAHLTLLPCVAAADDWEAWDLHYEAATRLIRESGLVERDVATTAELAGTKARARPGKAIAILAFAAEQWSAMGMGDEAERVRAQILSMREP